MVQKTKKEPRGSDNSGVARAPRALGRAIKLGPKHSKFSKKQKVIAALSITILAALISYLVFFKDSAKEAVPISKPSPKASIAAPKIYSPLTGAEVSQEQANRALTAVIVENSVDARPQSGLTDAGIIFEAIAEGGITRFATIYQEAAPQELGPVRSLRPYYLDWLRPFNASIAHVGGSQKALKQVRDGTWKDMDQFAHGSTFWRSSQRRAPHNVYTSFQKIDALNNTKGYKLEDFPAFLRKDDQKSSTPIATEVKMNISSKLYNSVFSYNPDKNNYPRAQGGAAHLDKSGTQLQPKVVVALIANYSIVQEDGSRSAYRTTGSGEAVVFQDGLATPVTWEKPSQTSQIKLKDATGNEIKLNRGQTWFTVLSTKDKLSYN